MSKDKLGGMLLWLRDVKGYSSVALIGHSMGGVLAWDVLSSKLELSRAEAPLITSVVTVDSPLGGVDSLDGLVMQLMTDAPTCPVASELESRLLMGAEWQKQLGDGTLAALDRGVKVSAVVNAADAVVLRSHQALPAAVNHASRHARPRPEPHRRPALCQWCGADRRPGRLGRQRKAWRGCLGPPSGYTAGMKTAVSLPDDVFAEAEMLSRTLGTSRSSLYAAALREYLARHRPDAITAALDALYRAAERSRSSPTRFSGTGPRTHGVVAPAWRRARCGGPSCRRLSGRRRAPPPGPGGAGQRIQPQPHRDGRRCSANQQPAPRRGARQRAAEHTGYWLAEGLSRATFRRS